MESTLMEPTATGVVVAEMEAFGFHWIWFRLKKTVKEWRVGE